MGVCLTCLVCIMCCVCVDLMKQKDEMHLTYAELREKYEVRHTSKPKHTHKDHTHKPSSVTRCDTFEPSVILFYDPFL
jgi:hypothetical protein